MSLLQTLKEKRQSRKAVLDAAGAILTKAHTEKRALTTEDNSEFDKRHVEGDALKSEIERLEKQLDAEKEISELRDNGRQAGREDTTEDAPAGAVTDLGSLPAEKRENVKRLRSMSLRAFLACGVENLVPEIRSEYARLEKLVGVEYRALSASTGNAGQYTIPNGFVYQLETALKYYGGIVNAADYIDTEMGNQLPWPSMNDTGNTGEGPLAENSEVAGGSGGGSEQDPVYGIVNFAAYMFDTGFVLVPIQLLQDSAFDVEGYLNEQLRIRIGRKLNAKCTTGSGSSDVKGVIPAATAGITAAGASAITYNDLLGLFHSVDPAYREGPKVAWMFNDSTLLAIKKLVDGNGRPLFIAGGTAEGIQNAAPDRIHGKAYWINQDMASIATGNKTILFGDFSKYKIRRVRTLQIVKAQERFIDQLQIGFLGYQRFDGNIVDAGTHPLKYITQA